MKNDLPRRTVFSPTLVAAAFVALLVVGAAFGGDENPLCESFRADFEKFKRAIQGGANPNGECFVGSASNTPLVLHAENSPPEFALALIDAGADVNRPNKRGWSPLLAAAAYGDVAVMEALIDAGAEVNYSWFMSPEAFEKTAGRPPDPGMSLFAGTPLMLAARFNRDPESVRLLHRRGADLRASLEDGTNAMHHAAMDNTNPEMAATLVELGFSPNAPTAAGATPLHLAATYNLNSAEVARALLCAGAAANAGNRDGATPLMLAAVPPPVPKLMERNIPENAARDLAKVLIRGGADVNARAANGATPLMTAAWKNEKDIIALLLARGADPSAADNEGKTARDYLRRAGGDESVLESLPARESFPPLDCPPAN